MGYDIVLYLYMCFMFHLDIYGPRSGKMTSFSISLLIFSITDIFYDRNARRIMMLTLLIIRLWSLF